jgi:hypothetical protein
MCLPFAVDLRFENSYTIPTLDHHHHLQLKLRLKLRSRSCGTHVHNSHHKDCDVVTITTYGTDSLIKSNVYHVVRYVVTISMQKSTLQSNPRKSSLLFPTDI